MLNNVHQRGEGDGVQGNPPALRFHVNVIEVGLNPVELAAALDGADRGGSCTPTGSA
jgi:hypothetical protein